MSVFADIYVPQISQDELFAFHASHFADVSVAEFGVSFIGLQVPPAPVQVDTAEAIDAVEEGYYEEYECEEGEEEYGDYNEPFDPSVADLVPDFDFAVAEVAQPAITNENETTTSNERNENHKKHGNYDDKEDVEDAEDGEIPEGNGLKAKKKKRRKKKNGAGNTAGSSNTANQKTERQGRPHKPDLRKRTWDVVDKGLGSLDYDDSAADPGCMPAPLQRRRIQYED